MSFRPRGGASNHNDRCVQPYLNLEVEALLF